MFHNDEVTINVESNEQGFIFEIKNHTTKDPELAMLETCDVAALRKYLES
ncbi:hypothetical protein [uncultured Clostridium sp.]|nr:hypothetical protein [uncultured Clostridium sp.]